jgi:hypothetical protein
MRNSCRYNEGCPGTEGTALFLAACAATAATDPAVADIAVDLAAKLIAAGADPNGDGGGTRPGVGARCGAKLPPVALALAVLEAAAGDEDTTLIRVPVARLAAILLAAPAPGVDLDARAVFSHRPDARELRSRRVVPGAPCSSPSTSTSPSYAVGGVGGAGNVTSSARMSAGGGSSDFQSAMSGGGSGGSDLRSAMSGGGSGNTNETIVNAASITVLATGTPLWFAACAVVEGAGAPALALAKKCLELSADPSCVGSRPGHCGAETPVLAMAVAALEGR